MTAAIDTNVLLDLLGTDVARSLAAQRSIDHAASTGSVAICPVVYAELAAGFARKSDLDQFLLDLTIQRQDFTDDAIWQAGQAWRNYARRRGRGIQCPHCGHRFDLICPSCSDVISWRQHLIPDFLVGAHALVQTDVLITRDPGYYRTYFPRLRIEEPVP